MANEEGVDELKAAVGQLIKVEEEVIALTEKTINQAESVTVKYLLKAIQHDSRKHADFGQGCSWRSWASKKLWGRRKEKKYGIY